MRIREFQEAHLLWARHNFPAALPHMPLLGIVEEIGELSEAQTEEEVKDAIGDIMIYITDYATKREIDLVGLMLPVIAIDSRPTATFSDFGDEMLAECPNLGLDVLHSELNRMQIVVGRLAHSHLKSEQNIRIAEDHEGQIRKSLYDLIFSLGQICIGRAWGFEDIMQTTWDTVKVRDWTALGKAMKGMPGWSISRDPRYGNELVQVKHESGIYIRTDAALYDSIDDRLARSIVVALQVALACDYPATGQHELCVTVTTRAHGAALDVLIEPAHEVGEPV